MSSCTWPCEAVCRGVPHSGSPRDTPSTSDIEVPYLAAWQAVELLVQRHGEDAVRRLIVASSSTGTDAQAETATDRALRSELRTTRADLTRDWLGRRREPPASGPCC